MRYYISSHSNFQIFTPGIRICRFNGENTENMIIGIVNKQPISIPNNYILFNLDIDKLPNATLRDRFTRYYRYIEWLKSEEYGEYISISPFSHNIFCKDNGFKICPNLFDEGQLVGWVNEETTRHYYYVTDYPMFKIPHGANKKTIQNLIKQYIMAYNIDLVKREAERNL